MFECQLMPALVYVLQTHLTHGQAVGQEEGHTTRRDISEQLRTVEFGTVIVYSCSASCWEGKKTQNCHPIFNFKREMVFVQSESTV